MENQSPPNKSCLVWISVGILVLFGAAKLLMDASASDRESYSIRVTQYSLKDIDTALFQYAGDHNDRLPAADTNGRAFTNSNEVFRELFRDGYLGGDAEDCFEVPHGPAKIDHQTGGPPGFPEALKPGECHWANVKDGSYTNPGPLVWENSFSGGWNPVWDPTLRLDKPGRTYSGARVFILTSRHAVKTYKLADPKTPSRLQNLDGKTTNLFTESGNREALDPVGLK